MKTRKFVIGVDPGLDTGGIAFLPEDYNQLKVFMTPRFPSKTVRTSGTKSGKRTIKGDIDVDKFADMIMEACVTFCRSLNEGEEGEILFILEDVHNIKGVSSGSNFNFGVRKGEIRGMGFMCAKFILSMFKNIVFYVSEVSPKEWQSHSVDFTDRIYTGSKLDTKASSARAAVRHFPNTSFTKERGTVIQDGITDAALIAKYGMEVVCVTDEILYDNYRPFPIIEEDEEYKDLHEDN